MTAASISLRSAAGVSFGTVTDITLTDLTLDCPSQLAEGDALEFQLELPGLLETVYGSARVHHVERFPEFPDRYQLRIQRLRAGDEVLLREWVDEMKQGGSSARPHLHVRPNDISSIHSAARTVDISDMPPGAVSTWDAQRAAEASNRERGRGSVRAMLRQRAGRSEPEPTPSDREALDAIEIEITEP